MKICLQICLPSTFQLSILRNLEKHLTSSFIYTTILQFMLENNMVNGGPMLQSYSKIYKTSFYII